MKKTYLQPAMMVVTLQQHSIICTSKGVSRVSTNLTDEELARRYTPQIVSRLAGEYLHLPFVGRDIRRLRR